MTDLTEQLYAGTLPTGHYYFNNGVETYIVLYSNANTKDMKVQEPSGLTVISEVPTYEEWEQTQNWADFTKDYHELREKLEIAEYENAQLKEYERIVTSYNMKPIDYEIACETVNKLLYEKKAIKEENTKLKKDCKTLAQKLLQVKPELREWLEVNYKEYL